MVTIASVEGIGHMGVKLKNAGHLTLLRAIAISAIANSTIKTKCS